jgi:hypothetical protein
MLRLTRKGTVLDEDRLLLIRYKPIPTYSRYLDTDSAILKPETPHAVVVVVKEDSLNEGYTKIYMLLIKFCMLPCHVVLSYTSLCKCVPTSESQKKNIRECTGRATCICEYSQPPGTSTPLKFWGASY